MVTAPGEEIFERGLLLSQLHQEFSRFYSVVLIAHPDKH
jgi:hypothetical protein